MLLCFCFKSGSIWNFVLTDLIVIIHPCILGDCEREYVCIFSFIFFMNKFLMKLYPIPVYLQFYNIYIYILLLLYLFQARIIIVWIFPWINFKTNRSHHYHRVIRIFMLASTAPNLANLSSIHRRDKLAESKALGSSRLAEAAPNSATFLLSIRETNWQNGE